MSKATFIVHGKILRLRAIEVISSNSFLLNYKIKHEFPQALLGGVASSLVRALSTLLP